MQAEPSVAICDVQKEKLRDLCFVDFPTKTGNPWIIEGKAKMDVFLAQASNWIEQPRFLKHTSSRWSWIVWHLGAIMSCGVVIECPLSQWPTESILKFQDDVSTPTASSFIVTIALYHLFYIWQDLLHALGDTFWTVQTSLLKRRKDYVQRTYSFLFVTFSSAFLSSNQFVTGLLHRCINKLNSNTTAKPFHIFYLL